MPKKTKGSEKGWDKIGMMVGKKIEKECGGKDWKSWHKWGCCQGDSGGGFFGRALFIIGLLLALNAVGVTKDINIWFQVMMGAGFALMRI